MQWPSWNPASVNLRLSLEMFRPTLEITRRVTRRQSARSRNFNSRMMRTRRTRTACLNLHLNCNRRSKPTRSKLRRLKKLQLSILLNSARLNKNLRKLRTVQDWQRVLSMLHIKQRLETGNLELILESIDVVA